MTDTPEIIVIGGGIAGAAFSTVMARAGHSILMLEITPEHRDVVRGEWLAPWGVAEAKTLGLYDIYRKNGGHHLKRHITYDEGVPAAEAEARTLHFDALIPGDEGPLTLGHPKTCGLLDDAAVAAGTRFLRGVRKTHVTPGNPPTVTFEHGGQTHSYKPRLVIAADGRHGKTNQQAGIALQADAPHHWFSGMLVEGAHDWPADLQSIGTTGDINFLIFPQEAGKVRLYLGAPLTQKDRFMGDDAPVRFAKAFAVDCLPNAEAIANAKPASHCFVYPNSDSWSDKPYAPGVVAIGDAAGHNDPIIGQGLSITHRDVRVVTDLLKSTSDWTERTFAPYAEERTERLRRLRLAARFASVRDCEFDDHARKRRHELHAKLMLDPVVTGLSLAPIIGPDKVPAEAFNEAAVAAALA